MTPPCTARRVLDRSPHWRSAALPAAVARLWRRPPHRLRLSVRSDPAAVPGTQPRRARPQSADRLCRPGFARQRGLHGGRRLRRLQRQPPRSRAALARRASSLAGLVAAAIGLLFGLPSLRLRGFYLAVSTLAAQFFVQWALTKFSWFSNDTPSGRHRRAAAAIARPRLRRRRSGAIFRRSPIVTMLTFARLAASSASQTGRNFIAIRDNETRRRGHRHSGAEDQASGLRHLLLHHRRRRRALGLRLSAAPSSRHGFDLDRSFQILFIIIIGGLGLIRGAFFGAALIVVFPLALSRARRLPARRCCRLRACSNMSQRIVLGAPHHPAS